MRRHLIAAAVMLAAGSACDRRESGDASEATYVPVATQPATQSAGWTPSRVESDPDGYLRWWDEQVSEHSAPLRREIEALSGKRQEWEGTWRILAGNVALAEGARDQLYRQYQLTQYTEPPPETISVAGRQVRRAGVPELLKRIDATVLEQQRLRDLAQANTRAVDSRLAVLESQVQRFLRIGERVKLDVGVVKETRSAVAVDVEELRRELESAAASATPLDAGTDLPIIPATLPTSRPTAPVTFDELLG